MSDTRQKLKGAKIELARMRSVACDADQDNFIAARDAFLSAARSIADYLHSELENSPLIQKQYDDEWRNLKKDPLVDYYPSSVKSGLACGRYS